MIRALDVILHGQRIGQITLLPGENTLFSFEEEYITSSHRLTLSQSFMAMTGQIITQWRPIRTRIHPFFSNLLPEGHLRKYLALKNQISPQREFDLIEALGEDLPGAVVIRSSTSDSQKRETDVIFQDLPPEE